MGDREYRYKAFISYRHLEWDKAVADRLQKMLESYKPPRGMRAKGERWRVFRDETELPTSSNLSNDIRDALENSEFLIVICSDKTAQSRWCMEEINHFKSLHGNTNQNIITLLIKGEPQDVFPEQLCRTMVKVVSEDGSVSYREEETEPLAANINADSDKESFKKLKTEFLRIAAPLIGCRYDDLYNRQRRRSRRRIAVGTAAAFAFVSMFAIYSSVMLIRINNQNSELLLRAAEMATTEAENQLTDGRDRIGALKTALSVRPYAKNPQKLLPETERLLVKAMYAYTAEDWQLRPDRVMQTESNIEDFMYSPDGKHIAAYDELHYVYVWDAETGQLEYKECFESLRYVFDGVVFPDNDSIIVAAEESFKKISFKDGGTIWEMTARDAFENENSNGRNLNFTYSSDAKKLAIWNYDGLVMFFDTGTGERYYKIHADISGYEDYVLDLHYDFDDGVHFAAAVHDSKRKFEGSTGEYYNILMIDTEKDKYSFTPVIGGHLYDVQCIGAGGCAVVYHDEDSYIEKFDYDGNRIFSAYLAGLVSEAEITTAADDKDSFVIVTGRVSDMAHVYMINPAGGECIDCPVSDMAKLICNDSDNDIEIYTADGNMYRLTAQRDKLTRGSWSDYLAASYGLKRNKDGVFAAVDDDRTMLVTYGNIRDNNYIPISGEDYVSGVYTCADYIIREGSKTINIYDIRTKEKTVSIDYDYIIDGIDTFNNLLLVQESNKKIHMYDIETGEDREEIDFKEYTEKSGYWAFIVPENESRMIFYTKDSIYVTENGEIRKLEIGEDYSVEIEYNLTNAKSYRGISPDGRKLILQMYDSGLNYCIAMIDTETGELINLTEPAKRISNSADGDMVSFSPDSETAACVFEEEVRIFDTETGEVKLTIPAKNNSTIRAVCFEPDGSRLLVHEDNSVYYTVYEYDAQTGGELNSLTLPIESDYLSLSAAKTLFIPARNQVIFSHSTTKDEKYAWFVDMDTFRIAAETNDHSETFMTFIEETQEIILQQNGREFGAYPYLTTAELIEKAEELIAESGR